MIDLYIRFDLTKDNIQPSKNKFVSRQQNQKQIRLKICENLRAAILNSKFPGSYNRLKMLFLRCLFLNGENT